MFCVSFLKERDCSLRLAVGEQVRFRTKRTEPDFCAGGRRSGKQCSDTKDFVARNCRGATRSAESRRMNTTEINAACRSNIDAGPLTDAQGESADAAVHQHAAVGGAGAVAAHGDLRDCEALPFWTWPPLPERLAKLKLLPLVCSVPSPVAKGPLGKAHGPPAWRMPALTVVAPV